MPTTFHDLPAELVELIFLEALRLSEGVTYTYWLSYLAKVPSLAIGERGKNELQPVKVRVYQRDTTVGIPELRSYWDLADRNIKHGSIRDIIRMNLHGDDLTVPVTNIRLICAAVAERMGRPQFPDEVITLIAEYYGLTRIEPGTTSYHCSFGHAKDRAKLADPGSAPPDGQWRTPFLGYERESISNSRLFLEGLLTAVGKRHRPAAYAAANTFLKATLSPICRSGFADWRQHRFQCVPETRHRVWSYERTLKEAREIDELLHKAGQLTQPLVLPRFQG